MSQTIVEEMERAFLAGEMDDLKASLLPFIRSHKEKLKAFISDFQKVEGPCPLDLLIKVFILRMNMPFDMKVYMNRQTHVIQAEIEKCEGDERQRVVSEWIRKKAESHRSKSMFQQVYCFEKLKYELLPQIKEELELDNLCVFENSSTLA